MDSREVTPELTRVVIHLVGEIRSFRRTAVATEKILGNKVASTTAWRLAKQVGLELAEIQDADEMQEVVGKEVVVPEVAVASCDGGRIRTREPDQGRGVTLSGETGWRETKNASLERMSLNDSHAPGVDPCPELPTSFRTPQKAAQIAEKPAPEVVESDSSRGGARRIYEGPSRVLRTALSSMATSDQFGRSMQREARRRRFYESALRAFLGDGLNWNWSIWEKYFPTFVPILDFIHAIQYVFSAAMAMNSADQEAWATYLKFVTLCWQGQVGQVIDELTEFCQARQIQLEGTPDDDPNKPIVDAVRYFTNNRSRMDYPRYRRQGLPVTSAPMESLIKQINSRVKGTEMFWDDPEGAEAILRIRAAVLSDDDRLENYLASRPGYPFTRRSTLTAVAA